MNRFVIVGLGNFGASAAESLYAQGHEVIAIDQNPAAVDRAARFVTRAVVGDGRDRALLDRIGADGSDAGIVSTGDDLTAAILATLALRDLNVPRIISKVTSEEAARVMQRVGADETIFPERESGMALAMRLVSGNVFNYFDLGAGYSVQEMRVPTQWHGRSLLDLNLRQTERVTVIAVHDIVRDTLHIPPEPNAPLTENDTLLLAGLNGDLARLAQR